MKRAACFFYSLYICSLILCITVTVQCNKKAQIIEADWSPVDERILTRWAKDVSPDNVHTEYPRPQMVRQEWENLNGLWDYTIRPDGEEIPKQYDGKILVPFPLESALSGVRKPIDAKSRLWYRRSFEIPKNWSGKRIFLHFEAVDWETSVRINGKELGTHRGGYDPFSFDVTGTLHKKGLQEIVISVLDPTDSGYQPRGKQVQKPGGIWYTAVTGIWQTVWLEPVPDMHVQSLRIIPDIDKHEIRVTANCSEKTAGFSVELAAKTSGSSGSKVVGKPGEEIVLPIEDPKLWAPETPFLYDLEVTIVDSRKKKIDSVSSYFGMRKISLGKDGNGITRLFLNNQPQFMVGPLDQGWWPDGLYTAPTDEALRYDIDVTKKLGMNMLRKHVKIESRRFYYWCDKLGLLVWQDMPSGDAYIGRDGSDIKRSDESARQFNIELKRMIDTFYNHPSIIMWVAFNEGWGQFDTAGVVNLVKEYDPQRLVDNASGWADRGVGDVNDIHSYPGPAAPTNESNRAAVLGEFGGLGLPILGHTWQEKENWGYRSFENAEALTAAYLDLIQKLRTLVENGVSAAVYTQTTDVEIEVNGLMTYDREIIKMDSEKISAANRALYTLVK